MRSSVLTVGSYTIETNNGKTRVRRGWSVLANIALDETYTLPDGTRVKALDGGHQVKKPNGSVTVQICK